eukprot:1920152-Amphidinium_carterae.1
MKVIDPHWPLVNIGGTFDSVGFLQSLVYELGPNDTCLTAAMLLGGGSSRCPRAESRQYHQHQPSPIPWR